MACREVTLPKPLAKKGSAQLTALAAYTHVLRPEPAEVGAAQGWVRNVGCAVAMHGGEVGPTRVRSRRLRACCRVHHAMLPELRCLPTLLLLLRTCLLATVQVRQRDAQHVLFEGTAQLASPYTVAKQSTEVSSRLAAAAADWVVRLAGRAGRASRRSCRLECSANRQGVGGAPAPRHSSVCVRQPLLSECASSPTVLTAIHLQIKVGGSVQSATDVSPYKRSGNTLSYGPYSDVAPWATQQISGARAGRVRCLWLVLARRTAHGEPSRHPPSS